MSAGAGRCLLQLGARTRCPAYLLFAPLQVPSLFVRGSASSRVTPLVLLQNEMVRYTELENEGEPGGAGPSRTASSVGPVQNFRNLVYDLDPHMWARKSLQQIMVRCVGARERGELAKRGFPAVTHRSETRLWRRLK